MDILTAAKAWRDEMMKHHSKLCWTNDLQAMDENELVQEYLLFLRYCPEWRPLGTLRPPQGSMTSRLYRIAHVLPVFVGILESVFPALL